MIVPFPKRPAADRPEVGVGCIGNTVIRFPGTEAAPAPAPAPSAPVRRARGGTKEEDQRKAMLGKVHIAKKDMMRLPGFDETVYRDILEVNFGVSSSAELSNAQLHSLLIHFASLGWQAKKGRHRREAPKALAHDATGMNREARLEKIEAMLAEKGRAEGTDMPWGYAMSILKRQTANDPAGQVRSFDKASAAQLDDVIAALYRDARRKGRRAR